jgi:small-conductance mechanosensitive channel
LWIVIAIVFALALAGGPAHADDDSPDADLAAIRTELTTIQRSLHDGSTDAELLRYRASALAQQAKAADIATRLAPQLASLQARLGQLGTASAAGAKEDADVASQRAALVKSAGAVEDEVKLARLLSLEAEQLAAQVWTQRRSQFQARLGERTASILSSAFWSELRDDLPRDRTRMSALADELRDAAAMAPGWTWGLALLGLIAALLASAWAHRRSIDWIAARVHPGRLRRSLHALIVIVLWTAVALGRVDRRGRLGRAPVARRCEARRDGRCAASPRRFPGRSRAGAHLRSATVVASAADA